MTLAIRNETCRKSHNNTNPVQTGLNIVAWSEAEKVVRWLGDRWAGSQTLGDFGLALRPARDWLISFWLSADRDKPNRVYIYHLKMIIRPDANGQVVANDKDLNMQVIFYNIFSYSSSNRMRMIWDMSTNAKKDITKTLPLVCFHSHKLKQIMHF